MDTGESGSPGMFLIDEGVPASTYLARQFWKKELVDIACDRPGPPTPGREPSRRVRCRERSEAPAGSGGARQTARPHPNRRLPPRSRRPERTSISSRSTEPRPWRRPSLSRRAAARPSQTTTVPCPRRTAGFARCRRGCRELKSALAV